MRLCGGCDDGVIFAPGTSNAICAASSVLAPSLPPKTKAGVIIYFPKWHEATHHEDVRIPVYEKHREINILDKMVGEQP